MKLYEIKTFMKYLILAMSHCQVMITICILGLYAGATVQAKATPVQFGSNYYEFVQVPDPFTGNNNAWWVDQAAAIASVYNNVHGHLATITSQAENDFLFSLVSGLFSFPAGAWLGGKAPEGWLVGPEAGQGFTYTNWGGIEPNNAGYAVMLIGTPFGGVNPGQWGDDSGVQGVPDPIYDPVIGYFVEYEGAASVPEPSTMLLFGTGIVWLAGTGIRGTRKSRKIPKAKVSIR